MLHNIGLVQHQLGNYNESVKLYTTALTIVKKEFGDKHYKGMFINVMYRNLYYGCVGPVFVF